MTFTLPSRLAAATTPSQSAGAAALADAEDAAEAPAEAAADCDAGAGFDCAGDGAVEAAWLPPQPASTMASRATLRDERTVDGMPFTSLLLSRSCAPYWNRPDHLSRSAARSSGLAELTAGNSCFQWKGRVASMIRRELVNSRRARFSGGIRGSSGVLQQLRIRSRDSSGSERVHMAHNTSSTLLGSMSSSTTTMERPR